MDSIHNTELQVTPSQLQPININLFILAPSNSLNTDISWKTKRTNI